MNNKRIDESLFAGLVCYSILSYALFPVVKKATSGFFSWFSRDKDKDKDKDKNKNKGKTRDDDDDDDEGTNNSKTFNKLLMIADKTNGTEKDDEVKKKNQEIIDKIKQCSYDKDGNEVPIETRLENILKTLDKQTRESIVSECDKLIEDKDFKAKINQVASKIKDDDLKQYMTQVKKTATGGADDEKDVDDSDVEGGLSKDDEDDIKKQGAKGAEKPKEPRKVKKRPLERGEGSCYYYADDPEKQSIGKEGPEAIKAYVKYKKALAEWEKNNKSTNESLSSYLARVFS